VRAPPPSRADGCTLTHGELPLQPASGLSAMLRAQRRRETEGGWANMREELLTKVLEAAGRQQGGLGFSQTSATVRLVCAGWKAVHDPLVRRLVLRRETTDEAVGMLVRSFPAVASLEVKWVRSGVDGRGGCEQSATCLRSRLSTSPTAST
jgi:hypothetical protein